MLNINNLHAKIGEKNILKGVNLTVETGTVHAIMGPNGSGKSTLGHTLVGRPQIEVTEGSVFYHGQDLLAMKPEERARAGIFLSFQYPVEIPGVNNIYFLKAALNAKRKAEGLSELDAMEFMTAVKQEVQTMGMSEEFLYRAVNEGFSGGEKKRNEILQMSVLKPSLIILDEIDSGLDIDALKLVAEGINRMRSPDRSIILITHYQRLLNEVVPDFVHVLAEGKIVRSGDFSLVEALELKGYGAL